MCGVTPTALKDVYKRQIYGHFTFLYSTSKMGGIARRKKTEGGGKKWSAMTSCGIPWKNAVYRSTMYTTGFIWVVHRFIASARMRMCRLTRLTAFVISWIASFRMLRHIFQMIMSFEIPPLLGWYFFYLKIYSIRQFVQKNRQQQVCGFNIQICGCINKVVFKNVQC